MILYHYEASLFSEKIRLMLGYAGLPWQSVLMPMMPPRPYLDILTGGYRRTPVAQIGADVFCDTRIITAEIARIADKPALAPENCDKAAAEYISMAETDGFFAVVGAARVAKVILTLLKDVGLLSTLRFIKDRSDFKKSPHFNIPSRKQADQLIQVFLADLNSRLEHNNFVGGVEPSLADFAVWHLLWAGVETLGVPLMLEYQMVYNWYQRMRSFGYSKRTEIDSSSALAAAKCETRPLPESTSQHMLGENVLVAPTDYGTDPANGVLVANAEHRWIIARQTDECGLVHVHFPKEGFDIRQVS